MPRVLFLGQNPSSREYKDRGPFMRRVEDWATRLGVHHFAFSNVSLFPGDFKRTHVDYHRVQDWCYQCDKIITLGREADKVLLLLCLEHFPLPHPSGLNRVLNDKERVERLLSECRDWVHK